MYSDFFSMHSEWALTFVLLFVFFYDLLAVGRARRIFHPLVCGLMLCYLLFAAWNFGVGQLSLFGGMYVSTPIANVMKIILGLGTLIVFLFAGEWLHSEDNRLKQGEFYVLVLSTLLGMNFMLSSGHFLLFFIGLELASIPMSTLVAFDKFRHHSAEAGAKYILTALFSSGLMLFGLSFIYGTTGTLYFSDLALRLSGSPLQLLSLAFFLAGMGFKLSLVPFHLWTADSYQGAPTPVAAYLSVVSKGAAAMALMCILMQVFPVMIQKWQLALQVLIVITITLGNLMALRQTDLKRFMAFSSISQAGYILLAMLQGVPSGQTALVYYILVYLAANLAVFGVIGVVENKTGLVERDDYNGFAAAHPRLAFVMMLGLFSLAGIPPFSGFFSKFFVFMSAAGGGFYPILLIALLNTVISLYYYLLLVRAMYISPSDEKGAAGSSALCLSWGDKLAFALCLGGILLLGLAGGVYEFIDMVNG